MASKLFWGVRCNRDQQVTEVAGVPLCLQLPQKLTILDGRADGVAILLAHPIKSTHENRTKGCMLGLTRTAQTFWDAMFRGSLGLYAWHANVRKRKAICIRDFLISAGHSATASFAYATMLYRMPLVTAVTSCLTLPSMSRLTGPLGTGTGAPSFLYTSRSPP